MSVSDAGYVVVSLCPGGRAAGADADAVQCLRVEAPVEVVVEVEILPPMMHVIVIWFFVRMPIGH